MMVAQAAPLTPHPKYIMNTASSTMLTPLQIRVAHRGDLVSPSPLNTPCSSIPSSQQDLRLKSTFAPIKQSNNSSAPHNELQACHLSEAICNRPELLHLLTILFGQVRICPILHCMFVTAVARYAGAQGSGNCNASGHIMLYQH